VGLQARLSASDVLGVSTYAIYIYIISNFVTNDTLRSASASVPGASNELGE